MTKLKKGMFGGHVDKINDRSSMYQLHKANLIGQIDKGLNLPQPIVDVLNGPSQEYPQLSIVQRIDEF